MGRSVGGSASAPSETAAMLIKGMGDGAPREELKAVADDPRALAVHENAERAAQLLPLCGHGSNKCWRTRGEAGLEKVPFGCAVDETLEVVASRCILADDQAEFGAVAGECLGEGSQNGLASHDEHALQLHSGCAEISLA